MTGDACEAGCTCGNPECHHLNQWADMLLPGLVRECGALFEVAANEAVCLRALGTLESGMSLGEIRVVPLTWLLDLMRRGGAPSLVEAFEARLAEATRHSVPVVFLGTHGLIVREVPRLRADPAARPS